MNPVLLVDPRCGDEPAGDHRLEDLGRRVHGFFQLNPFGAFSLPPNWREYPQAEFLLRQAVSVLGAKTDPLCLSNVGLISDIYREALRLTPLEPNFRLRVEAPKTLALLGSWLAQVFGSRKLLGREGGIEMVGSLQLARCPDLVHRVWEACRGNGDLGDLEREFLGWRTVLAPAPPSGTRLGLAWEEGGRVRSATVPFLPSGGWQSIRLPFPAPPKTIVNGVLFNKPCRIWFRRFAVRVPSGDIPLEIAPGPGSSLSRVGNVWRLDAAYEARQVTFTTPNEAGPFELVLDLLLEAGRPISDEACVRLAERLHELHAGRRPE